MHEHFPFYLDDHTSPTSEHVDWLSHDLNGLSPLSEHSLPHDYLAPDHDFACDHLQLIDTPVPPLTDDGAGLHTLIDATPRDVLNELLQGHELSLLATPYDQHDFLSSAIGDLAAQTGGHAIYVQAVDHANPDMPILILADRSLPEVSVAVPMRAFLQPGDGHAYSFVAADKPWPGLEDDMDLDADKGYLDTAYAWLAEQTPRFVTGVFSYVVGDGIGELLDNEAIGVAAHFATEKLVEGFKD